jgi:hypothetical protein
MVRGAIEKAEGVGGAGVRRRVREVVVKDVVCISVAPCEVALGCSDFKRRTLRLFDLFPRDVDRDVDRQLGA